jgi:hypothetical protein
MKRRRPAPPPASPPPAGSRLAGVRPVAFDDDERPSREDRSYGETIFTRPPVPLPRFLTGRRKQPPR